MKDDLIKLRRTTFVVIFIVIIALTALHFGQFTTASSYESVKFLYEIFVNGTGYGVVKINIIAKGAGESWITLPSHGQYEYDILGGNVKWGYDIKFYTVFYDEVYFSFSSRDISIVRVKYDFPYISLIIQDKAWFLSPIIRVPKGSPCIVRVVLENVKEVIQTYPNPYERNSSGMYFDMTKITGEESDRVLIIYKLSKTIKTVTVRDKLTEAIFISVKTPTIYKENFVKNIVQTYRRALPYLLPVFGVDVKEIKVEFYLPETSITTLGYVTTEDISKYVEKGTVHLNLALIRFMKGYAEHTMIHELVHILLGKVGVPATNNLRWFHEGMADYIAYKVCLKLGYENVTDIHDRYLKLIDSYKERYGEKYGIVQNWGMANLYGTSLFYAISFYIIYTLGEKYGGLEYYKEVLKKIRERGKVSGTDYIVEALSYGANENLVDTFRKWGFVIGEINIVAIPYIRLVYAMLVAFTLVALWSMFTAVTRRSKKVTIPSDLYKKCPYCHSVLLPGVRQCPYCGRELL